MTQILIGLAVGLAAGVLSGLFGIGGGVVIVPALLLVGLTQRQASGTSLAALVLPVGIFGVIEYMKRGEVHIRYGLGLAVGLAIGVLVGAVVAGDLSNRLLQRGFGVLMLLLSLKFLIFPS